VREIKFRAWDKETKQWCEDVTVFDDGSFEGVIVVTENGRTWRKEQSPENLVLEQYTGLKDKHGKEIYEHDIAQTEGVNGKLNWVLKRDNEPKCYVIGLSWKPVGHQFSPLYNLVWEQGLIFGNIHQNPEIINE